MATLFPSYKIGLVMTRVGLNATQLALFKRHLQMVPKIAQEYVLVVPVVETHGHTSVGEHAMTMTEHLLHGLRDVARWRFEMLAIERVEDLLIPLRRLDEVWCVTGSTRESIERPGRIYRLAQAYREAPRFKLLHPWTELPQDMLPSTDARKKKPKALKG